MTYESVIGLEVHAQLLTESKIFCGCSTTFGALPNTQTCPVCLGLPGVLPVLNKKAVEYAMKMILAVGGTVAPKSIFARKNYFYPDLPKGYQISQFDLPLGKGGFITIEINGTIKTIRITRIHLEEDAGKSLHPEGTTDHDCSLVDVNRCGVPLIEIVSQPDLRSPQEAYSYLLKLKQIVEYLEICSGNMEEGNLRCDANVSVRPAGQEKFGTKTEVKNMNSFKAVEKALTVEIERQIKILESGAQVFQQTLLWDDERESVAPMRQKEESDDYRYFPEPDLLTLQVDEQWLEQVKKSLPELPDQRRMRFRQQYQLSAYDATILTVEKAIASYFEECVAIYPTPKTLANWIMGEVLRELKERKISIREFQIPPDHLVSLLEQIDRGVISGKMAKEVFVAMAESGRAPEVVIREQGLAQVSDTGELEKIINEVLAENSENLKRYYEGKDRLFGFFVGEVMKKTRGQANPGLVNSILKAKLKR